MLCANCEVRGIYTSDNTYEYATLPSDMRFKFAFDINRWEEFFSWHNIPSDWDHESKKGKSHYNDESKMQSREDERRKMHAEVDALIGRNKVTV